MTAAEYAYQLYYIKNGEQFNKGQLKDPSLVGVKALDPYTLQVELVNPTPFFLKLTAFHALNPVPPHVVSKFPGQEWTKEGNLVSNGPFKLTEWKLNRHIRLEANPFYWDRAAVKLKDIYFYPTENVDTEEKMFTAGKLHITNTVPTLRTPYYAQMAKQAKGYQPYKDTPLLASYFYRFNVKRKPTDDWRVRRALALTIDRKAIVERIMHGGQIPATTFTPPVIGYSFKGDLPDNVTPAAIAEAKKLLAEAGYPEGKGLGKIEILYNTNEGHKKIAVAIQDMWKKNLGIDVGLFNQEWKVYLDTQRRMDFTISRAGWAGQTLDQAKRFENFHKAEAILMKELPVLPIYFYTYNRLVSEHIKMIENGQFREWSANIMQRFVYKNFAMVDVRK